MNGDNVDAGEVPVRLSRDELVTSIVRFHDRVRHPARCGSRALLDADTGLVGSCLAKMKQELGGLADTFTIGLTRPEAEILALDLERWSPRTAPRLNRTLGGVSGLHRPQ